MQIVEFSYLGVRSARLTLRQRGSSIRFELYPMIHVADPAFYQEVQAELAGADVVVIEGVGNSLIARAFTLTYRVLPARRALGLVVQPDLAHGLSGEVLRPDLTGATFTAAWRAMPWWYRILLWAALPPVVVLMTVMSLLGGREWVLRQGMELAMDDLPTNQEVLDGAWAEPLDRVLLDQRDVPLVAALTAIHRQRQDASEPVTVAVVYGAAHVRAVLQGLYALGYRVTGGDWLTVMRST